MSRRILLIAGGWPAYSSNFIGKTRMSKRIENMYKLYYKTPYSVTVYYFIYSRAVIENKFTNVTFHADINTRFISCY